MLVLTRKNGESFVVGSPDDVDGPITITVLEIRSGRVKLGFRAADHVKIDRLEVREPSQSSGQSRHSQDRSRGARTEQVEQWEDDGGGAGRSTGRPAA